MTDARPPRMSIYGETFTATRPLDQLYAMAESAVANVPVTVVRPRQYGKSAGQRDRELVEAVRTALHPWPVLLWTDDQGTGRIRVGVAGVYVDVHIDYRIPLEELAANIVAQARAAWHARPTESVPDTIVLGEE